MATRDEPLKDVVGGLLISVAHFFWYFASIQSASFELVWNLKFRQWFCRPSFETALAQEEIPWRYCGPEVI